MCKNSDDTCLFYICLLQEFLVDDVCLGVLSRYLFDLACQIPATQRYYLVEQKIASWEGGKLRKDKIYDLKSKSEIRCYLIDSHEDVKTVEDVLKYPLLQWNISVFSLQEV